MPEFAHAEVLPHNGVPTIIVDGQPLHGMTATSVAFDDEKVVRDFVSSGVEIMMIWIEAPLRCWKGPGQYDWSYAEEKLHHFEQHSGDTRWIIRVRLGLVAPWFRAAFPAEVHNPPPPGEEASSELAVCVIHSSVWLAHVTEVIRDFVTWLKTTHWAPRIIGFMLNAGSTEEWLPFDVGASYQGKYHPVIGREFRHWLRAAYQNDEERLRQAWKQPALSFDSAAPPTGMARKGSHIWGLYTLRDPAHDRPAIDYYQYLNEALADAMITCCRAAKEAAGTPILAGGFHSYLWWETGIYSYVQEHGHGLVQRLNDSSWIDFISDITSYDGRYPGGPSGYLGLPHCQNLHGKLHYTEVDLRTTVNMPPDLRTAWKQADPTAVAPGTAEPVLPDPLWKWDLGMCGRDEDEQIALFQREHAHNLITGTPYWWFDIAGHNYQPPAFVRALADLSEIGKQLVHQDRRSISEVAFICSEDTPFYQSAMHGELLRFEMEAAHPLLLDGCNKQWGLCGFPYDTYELHDLGHPDFPGDQYKLLIFVNCAMTPKAADAGIRHWQRDGRVFCWTYAAAVLDEKHFDPALGEELIGMRLGCRRQRQNIHVQIDRDHHALTRGGARLNFGTEGSVGPVFFVDDSQATVLGTLRDGGEPAFGLRQHTDWQSVYLSMLNFGPALLRNLAEFAGAHVWSATDDVLYANRSLVCLHTASAGKKRIRLPRPALVTDVRAGSTPERLDEITIDAPAYRTMLWRTDYGQ